MIELSVLDKPYRCRTRDTLRFQETKQTIGLMVNEGKTLSEIRALSNNENIYNAASESRAREISQLMNRRLRNIDKPFLEAFVKQPFETQKIMCVITVMLEDHSFFSFMDSVYREKLIVGNLRLKDSDIVSFIHGLQSESESAAKWTDPGIKKMKDNFKEILGGSGLISSDEGTERKILRPIITFGLTDILEKEHLDRVKKILAGER